MPRFQQFLAVLCFYSVVMVNPESSEDGARAKELGKELLTSPGGKELGPIIAGHPGPHSYRDRRATSIPTVFIQIALSSAVLMTTFCSKCVSRQPKI